MFPDEIKSKAFIDYLRNILPGAEIEYRTDIDTFSYVFRIDYGSRLQIIRVERSFVDNREPDKICIFLDANNIREYLEKHNVKDVFISNRGISINNL